MNDMEKPKQMFQLTVFLKQRILEEYLIMGNRPSKIYRALKSRNYELSLRKIRYFIKSYESRGTIARKPGSGRPSKINSPGVLSVIQNAMEQNDELSGQDLKDIMDGHLLGDCGIAVRSLQRARKALGYTSCTVSYGQLIRAMNIEKRYLWAQEMVERIKNGYDFGDRIFCDESKIVKEVHALRNFVRKGQTVVKKPRPKYPYSIMVWGGISRWGKTDIVIFDGIMSAPEYAEILEEGYLPFIHNAYGNENCSLWQDNDPKHTSKFMREFYEENHIVWDPTPAESPDCNPIEFIWAELKNWLRNEHKPKDKAALIEGIYKWWDEKLTVEKCNHYIDHLYKAFPLVVENKGHPTGH